MKILTIATMTIILGCSVAVARSSAELPDRGEEAEMQERASDEIHLAADLPIAGGNLGRCTFDPPRLGLIRKSGVYYYEFCNYPTLPNYVWADVHQRSGSGGDMGGLVQSLVLSCSGYAALLTQKAKDLYCHD